MDSRWFALLLCFCWLAVPVTEARVFTDQHGNSIEAEIVRFEDDIVTLRLANGAEHRVSLDQFSNQDQAYLLRERQDSQAPADSAGQELVWDYEHELSSGSPVSKAAFRIWVPAQTPIRGMLVCVPGSNGDGRRMATDKKWQSLANELGFGIVACFFQDEVKSSAQYCRADNGSGEGLLEALSEFAEVHDREAVEEAPLLLWGHSAGGQFNFNFACLEPDRVIGFIVNKGGYYYDRATDRDVREIPAILFLGKSDKAERVENITKLFDANREDDALWALCREPGGHGVGASRQVAEVFFRALAKLRLPDELGEQGLQPIDEKSGWLGNNETGEIAPFEEYSGDPETASWLPDETTAKAWQAALQ